MSDPESIEKFKILQSKRNVKWVETKYAKPYLTKREFKSIIRRTGHNLEKSRTLLFAVDKEFNDGDDPNRQEYRDKFENETTLEMIERYQLDALTNVGAGSPDESAYKPFWILALGERIFTYWIQPGRLGLIVGETGSGKTSWLLWLIQTCIGYRPDET